MKQKPIRSLVQNKASVEQQKAQRRAAFVAMAILTDGLYGMPGIPDAERLCMVQFIQAMDRLANGMTLTEEEKYAWATVPLSAEQPKPPKTTTGGEILQ